MDLNDLRLVQTWTALYPFHNPLPDSELAESICENADFWQLWTAWSIFVTRCGTVGCEKSFLRALPSGPFADTLSMDGGHSNLKHIAGEQKMLSVEAEYEEYMELIAECCIRGDSLTEAEDTANEVFEWGRAE